MNVIESIKSALAPKSNVEIARANLEKAREAEVAAKARCGDDASSSSWEALAKAEQQRHRCEVLLSEAERRAAEAAAAEAAAKRNARLAELEALAAEGSYAAFDGALAKEIDRIIEGERLVAAAVKAIRATLQRNVFARRRALAVARELGVEVDLGPEAYEGNARGGVARALAKAKAERGEFRDLTVEQWVVPEWASTADERDE